MKIKLAILDNDTAYLERITGVFGAKYSDKLEVYTFTDPEVALNRVEDAKIDVLLCSDVFDINDDQLPKRIGFAFFTENTGVSSFNGKAAVSKFQRAEQIYKQIVSVYAEKANNMLDSGFGGQAATIIGFASPAGGVGTSSAAAAYALRQAAMGKRTLYLTLERYGSADVFFSGEGQFGLSDIIYALKSGRANLALKLESDVKQDSRGVYFFSAPKLAMDLQELSAEELEHLLQVLACSNSYDRIVVDMDFDLSPETMKLYRRMRALVWVSDGSETANLKLGRAFTALSICEQNADVPLTHRVNVLYNKFSNKTGRVIESTEFNSLGGVPRFEHATVQQVIGKISGMDLMDKIAQEVMAG